MDEHHLRVRVEHTSLAYFEAYMADPNDSVYISFPQPEVYSLIFSVAEQLATGGVWEARELEVY